MIGVKDQGFAFGTSESEDLLSLPGDCKAAKLKMITSRCHLINGFLPSSILTP